MAGERKAQNARVAAGAAAKQARSLSTIANAWFDDPEVADRFRVSAAEYESNPEAFAEAMPEITAQLLTLIQEQQEQERTDG